MTTIDISKPDLDHKIKSNFDPEEEVANNETNEDSTIQDTIEKETLVDDKDLEEITTNEDDSSATITLAEEIESLKTTEMVTKKGGEVGTTEILLYEGMYRKLSRSRCCGAGGD